MPSHMVYPGECSYALEENTCSPLVVWSILQMSVRSSWCIMLFKLSFSPLIFSVITFFPFSCFQSV
jgi:hypothetical protein